MGLLITVNLITWNVYGSTHAPPSRGFSYIEVWISGVQCNILLAIIEYTIVLCLKRSNLHFHMKSADMEKIIRLIDLMSFIASFIFFSGFNILYWVVYHP